MRGSMKHGRRGRIEVIIGLLLLAAALCITSYNFYEDGKARSASMDVLSQLNELLSGANVDVQSGQTEYPDYILNPQMDMPTKRINGLDYMGVLDIPALDLSLPVLSDYVFDNLRISPCRFAGSAYTDNLVICAHNYNSHFGMLKYMSVGDTMSLTDMDGNVFNYEIKEILVLDPSLPEEFIENGYALTLFTCTVSAEARVTVRCDRLTAKDGGGRS